MSEEVEFTAVPIDQEFEYIDSLFAADRGTAEMLKNLVTTSPGKKNQFPTFNELLALPSISPPPAAGPFSRIPRLGQGSRMIQQQVTNKPPKSTLIANPRRMQPPSRIAKYVPGQTSKFGTESSGTSRIQNQTSVKARMPVAQIPIKVPVNIQRRSNKIEIPSSAGTAISQSVISQSNADRGLPYGTGREILPTGVERSTREIPQSIVRRCSTSCVENQNKDVSQSARSRPPLRKDIPACDTPESHPFYSKVPDAQKSAVREIPQSSVKKLSVSCVSKKDGDVSHLVKPPPRQDVSAWDIPEPTSLHSKVPDARSVTVPGLKRGVNIRDRSVKLPISLPSTPVDKRRPRHWQRPPSPTMSFRTQQIVSQVPQVQSCLDKNSSAYPSGPNKLNNGIQRSMNPDIMALNRKKPSRKHSPTMPTRPGSPSPKDRIGLSSRIKYSSLLKSAEHPRYNEDSQYPTSRNIYLVTSSPDPQDASPTQNRPVSPGDRVSLTGQPYASIRTSPTCQSCPGSPRGPAGQPGPGNRGRPTGLPRPVSRSSLGVRPTSRAASGTYSLPIPTIQPVPRTTSKAASGTESRPIPTIQSEPRHHPSPGNYSNVRSNIPRMTTGERGTKAPKPATAPQLSPAYRSSFFAQTKPTTQCPLEINLI